MPELPDVEIFRREVAEDTVGEVITSVTVGIPGMIKFISPHDLSYALKNQKIGATRRHGKNLFLKTKGGAFLRLHFGMTGYLELEKDQGDLHRHTSIALHFKSGRRLTFIDPRKFGSVEFIDNFDDFLNKAHIGPDVETLKARDFEALLHQRRGQIKPALMDQSLMSGLGNVYTDELLFQAGIHPEIKIDDLNHKDILLLFKKMKSVIKEAIKDHANRKEMPKNFLIHSRHQGSPCPLCKRGVIRMKSIGGRSTYFCESHQTRRTK